MIKQNFRPELHCRVIQFEISSGFFSFESNQLLEISNWLYVSRQCEAKQE